MSRELKKRILVTFALLSLSQVLRFLPIPGIELAAWSEIFGTAPDFTSGALSRATIGALGILPYFSASVLVILFFYFRYHRRGLEERDFPIEFYTLGLAALIALLQSYGVAIFLENLRLPDGANLIPNAGAGFRLLCTLALTSGVFLTVWLAHLISEKGLGNGVCLIILAELLDAAIPAVLDFAGQVISGNLSLSKGLFMHVAPVAVLFLGMLALVLARWQPFAPPSEANASAAALRLRLNGVGIVGIGLAQSVMFIPASLAVALPEGSFVHALAQNLSRLGVSYWLMFGIIGFLATYFWTAWAYRFGGAQATLGKFSGASTFPPVVEEEFERKLALATLPMAISLPLLQGALIWLQAKYSTTLVSLAMMLPLIAVACDLFRQYHSHQQMAAAFVDDDKESLCEACRGSIGKEESACSACGMVFDEKLFCETHPNVAAEAVCTFCQRRLCADCAVVQHGRHACAEHSKVETREGWATVQVTRTRLEAQMARQHLEERGIPARVFSNTIEPQYGTLGLFEINAVTPFLAYRELGRGRIRVLARARDWERGQSLLAEIESRPAA